MEVLWFDDDESSFPDDDEPDSEFFGEYYDDDFLLDPYFSDSDLDSGFGEYYGVQPASKAAVDSMPSIAITDCHVGEDTRCAVCTEAFQLGEVAREMPCKHIYHGDCILPWLGKRCSCPVCRHQLPQEEDADGNRKPDLGHNHVLVIPRRSLSNILLVRLDRILRNLEHALMNLMSVWSSERLFPSFPPMAGITGGAGVRKSGLGGDGSGIGAMLGRFGRAAAAAKAAGAASAEFGKTVPLLSVEYYSFCWLVRSRTPKMGSPRSRSWRAASPCENWDLEIHHG